MLTLSAGQASLPETCPVCAHTPISSDLCKPNKALRTTLKAFLRTEEKKRERERPSATPATPTAATPADGATTPAEAQAAAAGAPEPVAADDEASQAVVNGKLDAPESTAPDVTDTTAGEPDGDVGPPAEAQVGPCRLGPSGIEAVADTVGKAQEPDGDAAAAAADAGAEPDGAGQADGAAGGDQAQTPQQGMFPGSGQMFPNGMGFGMNGGMFPNMGWNGGPDFNPMAQFMPNGMFNFQNPMGRWHLPSSTTRTHG